MNNQLNKYIQQKLKTFRIDVHRLLALGFR